MSTSTNEYEYSSATTVDSNPWMTHFTVAYVIFVVLIIGPLVWIGRKIKKYLKEQKRAIAEWEMSAYNNNKTTVVGEPEEDDSGDYCEMTEVVRIGRHNVILGGGPSGQGQGNSDNSNRGPAIVFARSRKRRALIERALRGAAATNTSGMTSTSNDENNVEEGNGYFGCSTVNAVSGENEDADIDYEGWDSDDEVDWKDYEWKHLPPDVQAAAKVLGYTSPDLWDNNQSTRPRTGRYERMRWNQLTTKERWAATVLGLKRSKWSGENKGPDRTVVRSDSKVDSIPIRQSTERTSDSTLYLDDEIEGVFDDVEWSFLPRRVKEAAKVLGYNRRIWTFGGTTKSEQKPWKMLTDEERQAAAILGYNQRFWDHSKRNIDKMRLVIRGWDTFKAVVSYDRESRRLMKLAWPLTIESVIETLLEAAVTAIISHYLGPHTLAAYTVSSVCLSLADGLLNGLDGAEEILVAQAIGLNSFFLAGQYVQLSAFVYVVLAIPLYGLCVIFIDDLIYHMELGQEIVSVAKAYIPIKALSHLIYYGAADTLGGLMRCDGKGKSMAVIDIISHAIHVVIVAVAVIHFNGNLVTIAWIDVLNSAWYGIFVYIFCACKGWLKPYKLGMFKRFALENFKLVKGMLKMALPLSLGSMISQGEYALQVFFAAHLSADAVATWSIFASIWAIFEYAPGGISSASIIRIGFHLGNANPRMAKVTAYKSLLYTALFSAIVTSVFMAFSDEIITLYTDDESIFFMLEELVFLLGVGNVLMCVGSNAWSIVTAQSRTKLATAIYSVCAWFITIPLSALYVYGLNYNVEALASATITGYSTVALAMLYVVFTTNWAKQSMRIIVKANEVSVAGSSSSSIRNCASDALESRRSSEVGADDDGADEDGGFVVLRDNRRRHGMPMLGEDII